MRPDINFQLYSVERLTKVQSLSFHIDKSTLAFNTLASAPRDVVHSDKCQSIKPFMDRAREIEKTSGQLIDYGLGDRSLELVYGPGGTTAETFVHSLEVIAGKLKNDPAFGPVVNDTKAALAKLENEWKEDEILSTTIMQDITGLPLDEHFDVYVTHPCSDADVAQAGRRIICTYRDKPNKYNVVNLWYYICRSVLYEGAHEDANLASTKGRAIHHILELLFIEQRKRMVESAEIPTQKGSQLLLADSWHAYLQQKGHKDINQYIEQACLVLDSAQKKKAKSK